MENLKELISKVQIEERTKSLAKQIDEDYKGQDVVFITVLNGAMFFSVNLALNLEKSVKFTSVEVSSYGIAKSSSGVAKLKKDISLDITGKHVIIVEDIVDTGNTIKFLMEHLSSKNPASIKVASLLNKKERREVEVEVDYIGFEIPNYFVIGYGLDYEDDYRNLPYIGYIE